MGNQEILDYAVMLAREEDLETLGSSDNPDIDSLNGLVKNFKRQVLLSTDEVFELTRVDDGSYLYIRGHHREDEVVFGYFRGFAATETKYISEDADEILTRSSVGFMLKKFFTDNEYYMVPVENIDKVLDVNENFDKIHYADEIAEILSEETIDILRLAKLVRNLKCDDEELALVKAYLQSSVLPSQICDYVIAPGIVESGQFKKPYGPVRHYLDDRYRLSLAKEINGKRKIPILCFDYDDDKNKTSTQILLFPEFFHGYGKLT